MTQNIEEEKTGKCPNISVKEFAKMSGGQNLVQSDAEESNEKEKGAHFENISDDSDTEAAVSGNIVRGSTKPQCLTRQQKLAVVKFHLSKLSQNQLLELTSTLRNHINNIKQEGETEDQAEVLLSNCLNSNIPKVTEEEENRKDEAVNEDEEKKAKQPLIPLTINYSDMPSSSTLSHPALHMSGGMVVTINKQIDGGNEEATLSEDPKLIPKPQYVEDRQVSAKNEETMIPTVLVDKNMKRKAEDAKLIPWKKMKKHENAEGTSYEIEAGIPKVINQKETPADIEVTSIQGSTTCFQNLCKIAGSDQKPGKPVPGDPLPGLVEFIENLLSSAQYNPRVVCWEDQEQRVFRIVRLQTFYQVWRESSRVPINYQLLKKSLEICQKSMSLAKIPQTRNMYKLGEKLDDSCDTFKCKLIFPDKNKMKAVLEIENNSYLEFDRNLFSNVIEASRKIKK